MTSDNREMGLVQTSEGLEGRFGEVAQEYERWLDRQPLSSNTRRTYWTRVRGFLQYLAATPAEYGDPLSDEHARDYAVRDYKSPLKTVSKAMPSSVNLSLADTTSTPTRDRVTKSLLPNSISETILCH